MNGSVGECGEARFRRRAGVAASQIADNRGVPRQNCEKVQRDVRRQVLELARGGGYLFATIHNIPPEVPPENVATCFRAAAEFGKCSLVRMP
jgi:uroporphyrinogen decarboxylase